LPVSDRFAASARNAAERLSGVGLRVEVDARNEKLGARIRKAELQKVPAMLVIGEKEATAGLVSVRLRHGGDAGSMTINAFADAAREAVSQKSRELTTEVKDR
ncbi:MAG TPA: His/Gly/Thr/Pro-type tRNA ligase C-terminal domain-containing protein, partial [Thermoanaerobaculia bacterium]